MRHALPPRAARGEDLPALVVEDLVVADLVVGDLVGAADAVARQPLRWAQVCAFCLAIAAVGASVAIAWQVHDQDRLARHQLCITEAEARGAFTQSNQAVQVALANCFPHPQSLLESTEVVVPGIVSVHFGDAMTALESAGLRGRLISGPGGPGAYIIQQEPRVGVAVPAGTVVEITTRSP